MDLNDKVALVTGGASGIGLSTTKALLRNGVNVAICDISLAVGKAAVEQFQDTFGTHRVIFLQSDVTDEDDMRVAFALTKEHFGRLDIFVNSAGVFDDFNWSRQVDVNLKGTIIGTLLAWQHMGKEEGGTGGVIINVASHLALQPMTGAPIYCATEHAIVGFSRSCGTPFHLDRTGVRVVAFCPGLTNTPLIAPARDIRHLSPAIGKECYREMGTFSCQTPEHVAQEILQVIRNAASGSTWVCEAGESTYEISIPERENMRIKK